MAPGSIARRGDKENRSALEPNVRARRRPSRAAGKLQAGSRAVRLSTPPAGWR